MAVRSPLAAAVNAAPFSPSRALFLKPKMDSENVECAPRERLGGQRRLRYTPAQLRGLNTVR